MEDLPSPPNPLSRRERGRRTEGKSSLDAGEGTLRVFEDLVVGQAQDGEPCRSQEGIAFDIVLRSWQVMRAVGFDHESSLRAEEVDDVRSKRLLSSKLGPFYTATAKKLP